MWLRLPLVPVIVSVLVPVGVFRLVETVRVEVPEPPGIGLGPKLLLVWDGKPETLRLTLPVKPLLGLTVTV